jgi:hypothetical protein
MAGVEAPNELYVRAPQQEVPEELDVGVTHQDAP